MNFDLSGEQKLLQESMFSSAKEMDHGSSFSDRWKHLAKTGIIGICVDKESGGSGLGALDLIIALESLAKGNPDNGLSFALAAHTLSCVIPISIYGSASQKKKILPALMNGDRIACNAMTESESGSDVFTMQCTAAKKSGNYILRGTKTFISNNAVSTLALTYATTDSAKGFFGGISAFLVDKEKFSVGAQFSKMGLENCSLGEIIFNDAVLSEEDLLGKEGGGPLIFNHSMEWERICLAGIHLGAMHRVLAKSIDFVNSRKSSGQKLGKFQAIAHSLAEMQVLLEVSQSYAYRAAWLLDHKKDIGKEAAIAKLFISNSVKNFMLQAMQLFGGYGYIAEFGIEKDVRDSLASTIYSGTSEIQKNIIASRLGI